MSIQLCSVAGHWSNLRAIFLLRRRLGKYPPENRKAFAEEKTHVHQNPCEPKIGLKKLLNPLLKMLLYSPPPPPPF